MFRDMDTLEELHSWEIKRLDLHITASYMPCNSPSSEGLLVKGQHEC